MLARKGQGKEAKLSYHGHLMTENRNGLVVNTRVTTAYGSAEPHAGFRPSEHLLTKVRRTGTPRLPQAAIVGGPENR